MKTRYIVPSILMAGLIAFGSNAATASDEVAGALLGAGAGAVIGHAVGGNDAALFGGFVGAILGAAVADDDRDRRVSRPHHHHQVYRPAPVRHYAPPTYWTGPRHAQHQWRYEHEYRHDGAHDRSRERSRDRGRDRNRDRDGWRDGGRDWDRDGGFDRRGSRDDGPRNYRNW